MSIPEKWAKAILDSQIRETESQVLKEMIEQDKAKGEDAGIFNMMVYDSSWAIWAFGERVWWKFLVYEADCIDLCHAWNHLHSDIEKIDPESCVYRGVEKMQEHYKEFLNGQKDTPGHKADENRREAHQEGQEGRSGQSALEGRKEE